MPQAAVGALPVKKAKNYSLSLMRFLAMLSLTTCHMFQQAGHEITANLLSTSVQLFLIMSGYLYAHKDFSEPGSRVSFVLKNFVKILLDYYLCVILLILPVYYFVAPENLTGTNLLKLFIGRSGWHGVHHFWYICHCLLCYLITPMLFDIKRYLKARGATLIGLIAFIAAMELILKSYESYFMPYWLSCYVIGYFLPEVKSEKKLKLLWGISAVVGVGLTALTYWWKFYYYASIGGRVPTLIYYLFVFLFEYGVVIFGLAVFLSFFFLTRGIHWPEWLMRLFDKTDSISYDVYLVHMIFVEGCLSIIGRTGSPALEAAVTIAEVFIAAIILHWISGLFKPLISRLNQKL